jgi:tetratricopeptide (TPR) repeat protein
MSARQAATRATATDDVAASLREQALAQLNAGALRAAVCLFDRAIAQLDAADRRLGRWVSERGRALMLLGHGSLAIRDFDRAMALDPVLLSAPANKATVLQDRGRLSEAVQMHERACRIAPARADVHYNRANALKKLGHMSEALAAYKRAVQVDPTFHQAYAALINGLWFQGDLEAAQAYAEEACREVPTQPENFAGRALVRQSLGDTAGARADYEEALRLQPHNVGTLFNWIQMDKVRDPQDRRLALLRDAERRAKQQGHERATLHYALGKAYDDLREPDLAFPHFDRGARIKRVHLSHDEDYERRHFGRLLQTFTPDMVAAHEGRGLATEQPVFVVGMPRSGTTLTEQILHSHPQVFGAGELPFTNDALRGVSPGGRVLAADGTVARHGPEVLPERAEQYLQCMRDRVPDPDVARIVDKLPGNAWRVGFIHLMFPHARIIHCVRDPLDTCLSCFQKLFTDGQNWSYDLGELGRHYRRYHRLMQHWEKVLPGRMLTVRYEDTVADLEGQARRIVDHVGLDWDPACLAFHRTERPVQTASHSQVRQPLYSSSVRRWHAYRPHLQPLIDALGPLAEHARETDDAGA